MIKRILVGTFQDEIMIAVLEGNQLVELHLEEMDNESITGNIFLGKVENYVSSLDASFIDIGKNKNAFLRNKDFLRNSLGSKEARKKSEVPVKGNKIIVQAKKDPMGTKGPQVTTNIGIAGRYLVFMPFSRSVGVSKKIEDSLERKRLHNRMSKVVKDSGIIIRTVAQNVDYEVLEEEYFLLKKRWEEIHKQFQRFKKPRLLHDEAEILEYLMREKYDSTVDEVVTNSKDMFSKLEKILKSFDKKPIKGKLRLCKEDVFDTYHVSEQLEALYSRKIEMECGGWLVVDRTEAFTIIDINSGSNVSSNNTRDMALETNVQAATEVARQLRLRNLSGIIIVDFIDMEQENDRMTILKVLNEELKKDKAKTAVMGFTKLGLVEITRKRTSPPVEELLFEKCPICHGEGLVFSPKRILKMISVELEQAKLMKDVKGIQLNLHWSLSGYLNKEWREDMMKKTGFDSIDIDFSRKDPNGYDIKYKK